MAIHTSSQLPNIHASKLPEIDSIIPLCQTASVCLIAAMCEFLVCQIYVMNVSMAKWKLPLWPTPMYCSQWKAWSACTQVQAGQAFHGLLKKAKIILNLWLTHIAWNTLYIWASPWEKVTYSISFKQIFKTCRPSYPVGLNVNFLDWRVVFCCIFMYVCWQVCVETVQKNYLVSLCCFWLHSVP